MVVLAMGCKLVHSQNIASDKFGVVTQSSLVAQTTCSKEFYSEHVKEGPEGVKCELGFATFCNGKMGFRSLGLGFESEKKPKWEWDWCFISGIGTLFLGKKWWLGNGIGNPPSGPS